MKRRFECTVAQQQLRSEPLLPTRRARPRSNDELGNALDAMTELDAREESRTVITHSVRVPAHDLEGGADVRCEIDLRGGQSGVSEWRWRRARETGGSRALLTMRRSDWNRRISLRSVVRDERTLPARFLVHPCGGSCHHQRRQSVDTRLSTLRDPARVGSKTHDVNDLDLVDE